MGKRGPIPLPSAVKKQRGTYLAARHPKNELAPPVEAPDCPTWLDKHGQAEWNTVVPQLEKLGILSKIDKNMLANYCAAQSLALQCTTRYQQDGIMIGINGILRKHPLIKVAQEARAQARALAAEFGMSPSSRTRISVPEKIDEKSEDPSEAFLFRAPMAIVK